MEASGACVHRLFLFRYGRKRKTHTKFDFIFYFFGFLSYIIRTARLACLYSFFVDQNSDIGLYKSKHTCSIRLSFFNKTIVQR